MLFMDFFVDFEVRGFVYDLIDWAVLVVWFGLGLFGVYVGFDFIVDSLYVGYFMG